MTHYEREHCDCFPERLGFRLMWTAYELILPIVTFTKRCSIFYRTFIDQDFMELDYRLFRGLRLRLFNCVTLSVLI